LQIAVISDTHMPRGNRRLPEACVGRLREADLIVHAGDLMRLSVLRELEAYGPVVAVYGNADDVDFAAALDQGFRSSGWKGALTQAIKTGKTRRKTKYFSPYIIARLYADLGDKEQAFQWLDTAYREHDFLLVGLATQFQFDPLRSDPRFENLLRRIGLPVTVS